MPPSNRGDRAAIAEIPNPKGCRLPSGPYGREIEQRPPIVEPDLDALPAPDVELVKAEDAEHLQQVLIQMCRVVFVCSSDIQVQRFI